MKLRTILFKIILGACLALYSACQHYAKSDGHAPLAATTPVSKKINKAFPVAEHLYIKNDSLYIVTEKKVYHIATDASINYKNPFAAIYQVGNDSIIKSYNKVLNNLVYFTTYQDLGLGYRGYLYVLDVKNQSLVYDKEFKRKFLYSSAGIFIIDHANNKIFCINKPGWYGQKQTFFTAASMYTIDGNHFRFYRNIYERGEKTEDNSLIEFYHRSLTDNGKRGLTLPENLLKAK